MARISAIWLVWSSVARDYVRPETGITLRQLERDARKARIPWIVKRERGGVWFEMVRRRSDIVKRTVAFDLSRRR